MPGSNAIAGELLNEIAQQARATGNEMIASRPRSISRCFESAQAALWLIDHEGRIAYVSSSLAGQLGIKATDLVGRRCNRSLASRDADQPNEFLDALAVALAPASDLSPEGHQTLELTLPWGADHGGPSKGITRPQAHFVRLASSESGSWCMGLLGDYPIPVDDQANGSRGVLRNQIASIRSELDRWSIRYHPLIESLWAGESQAAHVFRNRIELATQVRSHIGVFGGNGCGSDQIMRWLSGRPTSSEPVVTLDGPLMDSELIGVYASSVLDTVSRSDDACATLVIDHIDEMADDAQNRLADWLKEYPQRLRLIASLHRGWQHDRLDAEQDDIADLAQHVAAPQSVTGLHPQITTALSTLPIVVPDLNDRMADFPLLAVAWLHHLNAIPAGQDNRASLSGAALIAAKQLDRETLDCLVAYPWPGQWDELGAALRHALNASDEPTIQPQHLPLAIRTYGQSGRGVSELNAASSASLDERVNEFESELILQAMATADGNKAQAARQLKISRARLLRKLELLGEREA